jgi:hypothetical protein
MRLVSEQLPSIIYCYFVLHNIANCLGDEGFELPHMNFSDNDTVEEQMVSVCGCGADRRLEISTAVHNMGLHFLIVQVFTYSQI